MILKKKMVAWFFLSRFSISNFFLLHHLPSPLWLGLLLFTGRVYACGDFVRFLRSQNEWRWVGVAPPLLLRWFTVVSGEEDPDERARRDPGDTRRWRCDNPTKVTGAPCRYNETGHSLFRHYRGSITTDTAVSSVRV